MPPKQIDVSRAMADRVRSGWGLTSTPCPLCETLLLRDPSSKRLYCCSCGVWAVSESQAAGMRTGSPPPSMRPTAATAGASSGGEGKLSFSRNAGATDAPAAVSSAPVASAKKAAVAAPLSDSDSDDGHDDHDAKDEPGSARGAAAAYSLGHGRGRGVSSSVAAEYEALKQKLADQYSHAAASKGGESKGAQTGGKGDDDVQARELARFAARAKRIAEADDSDLEELDASEDERIEAEVAAADAAAAAAAAAAAVSAAAETTTSSSPSTLTLTEKGDQTDGNNGNDDDDDDWEEWQRRYLSPPSPTSALRQTRSNAVSSLMGSLMLQGWELSAEPCPNTALDCSSSLMRARAGAGAFAGGNAGNRGSAQTKRAPAPAAATEPGLEELARSTLRARIASATGAGAGSQDGAGVGMDAAEAERAEAAVARVKVASDVRNGVDVPVGGYWCPHCGSVFTRGINQNTSTEDGELQLLAGGVDIDDDDDDDDDDGEDHKRSGFSNDDDDDESGPEEPIPSAHPDAIAAAASRGDAQGTAGCDLPSAALIALCAEHGWDLLRCSCRGCGTPLVAVPHQSKGDAASSKGEDAVGECVACGKRYLVDSKGHTVIGPAPAVSHARTTSKHMSSSSSSDDDEYDDGEESEWDDEKTRAFLNSPELAQKVEASRRKAAAIAERLGKGWGLAEEACADCLTPLVYPPPSAGADSGESGADASGGRLECVGCGAKYLTEKAHEKKLKEQAAVSSSKKAVFTPSSAAPAPVTVPATAPAPAPKRFDQATPSVPAATVAPAIAAPAAPALAAPAPAAPAPAAPATSGSPFARLISATASSCKAMSHRLIAHCSSNKLGTREGVLLSALVKALDCARVTAAAHPTAVPGAVLLEAVAAATAAADAVAAAAADAIIAAEAAGHWAACGDVMGVAMLATEVSQAAAALEKIAHY